VLNNVWILMQRPSGAVIDRQNCEKLVKYNYKRTVSRCGGDMKRMSRSLRKYIRKEKARIRREVLNLEEQKRLIDNLYKQFKINKN